MINNINYNKKLTNVLAIIRRRSSQTVVLFRQITWNGLTKRVRHDKFGASEQRPAAERSFGQGVKSEENKRKADAIPDRSKPRDSKDFLFWPQIQRTWLSICPLALQFAQRWNQ